MQYDTIVSQATPVGFSAIAIIRLSGPSSLQIAKRLSKTKYNLSHAKPKVCPVFIKGENVDQAVFIAYLSPKSYTGENIVEIFPHGNIHICEAIITECLVLGSRLAEPGEYTKRAFLNGKINLLQAESVAQLISAKSVEAIKQQTRNLTGGLTKKIRNIKESVLFCLSHLEYEMDVSEGFLVNTETISEIKNKLEKCIEETSSLNKTFKTGAAFTKGIKITLVGKPNVGKSTLGNKILGLEKSITSNTPGTTRDLVSTETILGGVPVTIVDTAGIHKTKNPVETEGVKRSFDEIKNADLVLSIFCHDLEPVDIKELRGSVLVYNKEDVSPYKGKNKNVFSVSAIKGTGVDSLINHIQKKILGLNRNAAEPLITTLRQKKALKEVEACLTRAQDLFRKNHQELDLLAYELRSTIDNIDLFTGKTTTNDILERVFSSFCVGK